MAMEWMDDFSIYGTGSASRLLMLNGLYSDLTTTTWSVTSPDGSGFALRRTAGSNVLPGWRRALAGTRTRVGIAQRIWLAALPAAVSEAPIIASFRNGSNVSQVDVRVLPNGALRVFYNSLGTSVDSTGPVLITNAFQHVEILVDFDVALGEIEVRVEGAAVSFSSALTGINTGAGCAIVAGLGNPVTGGSVPETFIKDLAVYNGLGSYNNDFIGSGFIVRLNPTSDVALNWTPVGAANGWSILDNIPPNDAAYIEAGDPPPSPYQAGLSNLPTDIVSVRSVQTVVRARKTDGGDGNIQVGMVSGVDTALGLDRPITASFTYYVDNFEEDPATLAAWTPVAVDAAVFQLDRTV
jgi:hypothetical protein